MKSTVKKEITKTELIVHMDVELENLENPYGKHCTNPTKH